ncbi:ester cyclase [Chitinophaga sp. YIM B06452]|uniref:ester cyclase n=1 Tax=Chitinophaga sp. YIM B06452 TaxID=3082158 RepID=UPI0031FE9043
MRNAFAAIFAAAVMLAACNGNRNNLEARVLALQKKVDSLEAAEKLTAERLLRFDSLDFQFYSGQLWDSLSISHANDIKVHYPDGSSTEGLSPQHIDRLKPLFVFAPDTKITRHPIRFGTGNWTCVTGIMEGTFSQPMPLGNGRSIPPTGKKFSLTMATIGHWQGGRMTEEYLFWDNQAFMQQIGLGK